MQEKPAAAASIAVNITDCCSCPYQTLSLDASNQRRVQSQTKKIYFQTHRKFIHFITITFRFFVFFNNVRPLVCRNEMTIYNIDWVSVYIFLYSESTSFSFMNLLIEAPSWLLQRLNNNILFPVKPRMMSFAVGKLFMRKFRQPTTRFLS